jgi:dTDP-4-dehydrorhamnose 3,5-epimerase-like enzyme
VSNFQILELPTFKDSRGELVPLQDALPFQAQRMFWIFGADGQTRGGHRHHVNRQALIAMSGSVAVRMHDGRHRSTIVLDKPNRCLLVEPDDWHTMTFAAGAVLLVLASAKYDVHDYIDEDYRPGAA